MCNHTPEFSDILWHRTKIYGPNVFLLTKIKQEFSDILYNTTHFLVPMLCRISKVPLYYEFNNKVDIINIFIYNEEPSKWWLYGTCSWIYNYLCNQRLSPLTLWVRILLSWGVLDTALCDKFCQWLATGRWFSPGTGFLHLLNWPSRYNWNIVESGV